MDGLLKLFLVVREGEMKDRQRGAVRNSGNRAVSDVREGRVRDTDTCWRVGFTHSGKGGKVEVQN